MGNDLVISGSKPSFLAKAGSPTNIDKFTADLGGGMPLPVLSFRGKVFRLRKDGEEVSTKKNTLDVVLVDTRPSNSKRYYEDAYDPDAGIVSPTCSSADGQTPDVANPVSKSCATCPKNEWGSAVRNGRPSKGKACGDYRRLVVYPAGLASDDVEPSAAVLDVPATSLKAPRGSGEMMLREYLRALAQNGVDPMTYVVRLSFSDAEFPQLVFSPQRYVTEVEYAVVQRLAEEPDVEEALGAQAAEASGPVSKQEPEAEPEPEPKKAKKPEPKKAKKPEPEPEPEPEDDASQESEGSDEVDDEELVSELRGLLGG